ncbi:MAG: hypothetical protein ACTSRG_22705 [Candidatus Helarchaeota archaeon]
MRRKKTNYNKLKENQELKIIDYETRFNEKVEEFQKYINRNLSEKDYTNFGADIEDKIFRGEIDTFQELRQVILKINKIK